MEVRDARVKARSGVTAGSQPEPGLLRSRGARSCAVFHASAFQRVASIRSNAEGGLRRFHEAMTAAALLSAAIVESSSRS